MQRAQAGQCRAEPEEHAEGRSWCVYVLVSESRARTYVGISTDAQRRLAQHNGLHPGGARATRAGRPWSLGAVFEGFSSRADALRAEREVRALRGRRRLAWRSALEPEGEQK